MFPTLMRLILKASLFVLIPLIVATVFIISGDYQQRSSYFSIIIHAWLPLSFLCAIWYLVAKILQLRQSQRLPPQAGENSALPSNLSSHSKNISGKRKNLMIALMVMVNALLLNLPDFGLANYLSSGQAFILASILSALIFIIFMKRII
jgi:hypothetical protein